MTIVANRHIFLAVVVVWLALVALPQIGLTFPDSAKLTLPISVVGGQQAITPNGRFVAVLSQTASTLSLIDTAIFAECAVISLSATPTGVVAAADSSRFFVVTNSKDGLFEIDLDPDDGNFVTTAVDGINTGDAFAAIARDGDLLFLLNEDGDNIHIFDTALGSASTAGINPIVPSFSATALEAFSENSRLLVVGSDGSSALFDSQTFAQIGVTLDLSQSSASATTAFMSIAGGMETGGTVVGFVANSISSGEVFALNLDSLSGPLLLDANPATSMVDPIAVGDQPVSLLLTDVLNPLDTTLSSDQYLYIANQGDKRVDVVPISEFFDSDSESASTIANIDLSIAPAADGLRGNAANDGYLYQSLDGSSSVAVITDNPLVTLTTTVPSLVSSGSFNLDFQADEAGSYDVRVQSGDGVTAATPGNGALLASGSLTANEVISVQINAGDFNQGSNLLIVFVTVGSRTGRVGAKVEADLPPPAPEEFELEFGNQKVFVQFRSLSGDIDFYRIFFGTSKSALNGTDLLTSPTTVDHPDQANQKLTEILSPLSNGVEIFVQVAAVSDKGVEGERTEILAETPEETIGLLEITGETGGCGRVSSTGSHRAIALSTIVVLLFLLLSLADWRKTLVKLGMLCIWIPSTLWAQSNNDLEYVVSEKTSRLPIVSSFRISWWLPQNDNVEQFFGDRANEVYSLRIGLPLQIPTGVLEPALEAGLMVESSRLLGVSSGRSSGEESSLLLVPLRLDLTYLIDPNATWLVVPLLEAGYGWTFFDIEENDQQVDGFKQSLTFRGGFRLLIDRFVKNPEGWREFLALRSAYFAVTAGYELPLASDGFKTTGVLISPEIGVVF